MCSSASFICSCGTEFTEYKHMQEHSTTHEPGHQVLDHKTIRNRRIEKRIEEEEKLKRLQKGEVIWNTPKMTNAWTKASAPPVSLPVTPVLQAPSASVCVSQLCVQPAKISQVPELYPSMSQASLLPNPASSTTDMQNIFADVGAPTVDLWTLYQPVVLLPTVRKFNKQKPYSCGKCGQCFFSKTLLISHHNFHVADKISGCIGCGLLLSSKKIVPRYHVCNSPNNGSKFRLVTAKPLGYKTMNVTSGGKTLSALGLPTTSSLQVTNQNIGAPHPTPVLKIKSVPFINNKGVRVTPLLQFKNASNPNIGVSFPSKPQTQNPSLQLKMPTNSAGVSSASSGFPCRVCHISFETAQLLQRHKCVKAREFMAQHVRGGMQQYKEMMPAASPVPAQVNGKRKYIIPPSGNVKKSQILTVNLEKGPVNGNTGVDSDDDCYIVEGGPDKPAEMIYQVTSSVPIKT